MTFDQTGRMYVWEKKGKVYTVEDGIKNPIPLIDISEEVGGWRDFGLLGFALDPNFLSNGYIYLLYIVDRHHLLHYGTSSYNSSKNQYYNASIGRLTRYTAEQSTNYSSVDLTSRKVLLGATKENGFPNLHESHGTGALIFGTDGTLLVTFGDGASYKTVDEGSAEETYYQQALLDGIITPEENVGAYRSQLKSSLGGKILRIDPETGAGLPSNPFYQSSDPHAASSKIWALGTRNAFRIAIRPGSGSHNASDGDPGTFYFGDVGWGTREELNVLKSGGENFGWPVFEGMDYRPGYNNPAFEPETHTLPAVDWRKGTTPRGSIDGTIYDIGSEEIPGPKFVGNCSVGGVWYTGDDFPSEYKNTYFHADYGAKWIQNFVFDDNDNLLEVRPFDTWNGSVVSIATHPTTGGLYYIRYGNAIHKISYEPGGNQPPKAVASADVIYGASPLTVKFDGAASLDPENGTLTYEWDFGNGPESTEISPSYTFSSSNNEPTTYTVSLTVKDDQGMIDEVDLDIFLNNTPPVIQATSIDEINTYTMMGPTTLDLSATIIDKEHTASQLSYQWQTFLFHDNHNHPEPEVYQPQTSATISPIGCDGVLYYYKIVFTVTDPEGLSTVYEKNLYPDCGGPLAQNDLGTLPEVGKSSRINILINDEGDLDPGSISILSYPSYGQVQVDPQSGTVTYTSTKDAPEDSFTYTVNDYAGNSSNVAGVMLGAAQPPILLSLADFTYQQGDPVGIQLEASDPNGGDIISFGQQGLPESLSLDSETGLISGILTTSPGGYLITVRATDESGLYDEQQFTLVIEQLKPITYQATITQASCVGNDGIINLQIDDNINTEELSIAWSNGANTPTIDGLEPGSYTVNLSGLGYDPVSTSFVVDSSQPPNKPIIIKEVNRLWIDQEAESYQWLLNGSPIDGANSQGLTVSSPGIYSVIVTNKNGCSASSDQTEVTAIIKEGISVYPNPVTTGELNIVGGFQSNETIGYTITDHLGRSILKGVQKFTSEASSLVIKLDTYQIHSGIYLLSLYSDQQGSSIYRISVLY